MASSNLIKLEMQGKVYCFFWGIKQRIKLRLNRKQWRLEEAAKWAEVPAQIERMKIILAEKKDKT